MITEPKWTLSFLIGTPIWCLWLIAVILVIAWGIRRWRNGPIENDLGWTDNEAPKEGFVAGIVGVLLFLASIGLMLSPAAYYPYSKEYHQWTPVTGKVTQVEKRLISSGSSMAERYVFVIDGKPYGVDDTRAATTKVGDTVSIACIRTWEYASVPGYTCRWNQ